MERAIDSQAARHVKGVVERPVVVWPGNENKSSRDDVIEEIPVALVYNDISHVVMMATPLDLEEFALGFSLTEGIIQSADDIYSISTNQTDAGIEVSVTISSQQFMALKNMRRNLSGRTGCGICGAESLQQLRTSFPEVVAEFSISHRAIDRATKSLTDHQPLLAITGAIHGAAWCDAKGEILKLCEDVGRHNALDKLIGTLWRRDCLKEPGFLLISSRASYEIIQKSAMSNIGVVVAVSAPTSMAVDIAGETGITLVGFSRENRHVVYTNSERLVE